MKKIVNLFIVLLVLSSCSLDETQMPINVPKTDTIIDEEEIVNEVVALRNDLFGQPTKSISGIEITALSPLTKSSDITPYRSIVRNLFHINWGWGGKADGYYLLSGLCRDGRIATDPHIDSGQNTSGNFNYHDYICIVTYKTPSWW